MNSSFYMSFYELESFMDLGNVSDEILSRPSGHPNSVSFFSRNHIRGFQMYTTYGILHGTQNYSLGSFLCKEYYFNLSSRKSILCKKMFDFIPRFCLKDYRSVFQWIGGRYFIVERNLSQTVCLFSLLNSKLQR